MVGIAARDRLAVHRHQQTQRLAGAVVQRKRRHRIHSFPGEQRVGRELAGKTGAHELERSSDDCGPREPFERIVEVARHAAVQADGQGAHHAARIVGEYRHENQAGPEAGRELAHKVGEQAGAAPVSHRQGDPAQGLDLGQRNDLGTCRPRQRC